MVLRLLSWLGRGILLHRCPVLWHVLLLLVQQPLIILLRLLLGWLHSRLLSAHELWMVDGVRRILLDVGACWDSDLNNSDRACRLKLYGS